MHPKILKEAYTYDFNFSKTRFEPGRVTFVGKHNEEWFPMDTNGYIDIPETGAYFKPYTLTRRGAWASRWRRRRWVLTWKTR